MAAQLLLLVCAAAVLCSVEAQESYHALPDSYKGGVDLALEQLSTGDNVKLHFRFWRSVDKSDLEGAFRQRFIYHHFYLKPTTCAKGMTVLDPHRCPFRNDRPLMDCAVCYKMSSGQIEPTPSPYIHCIQRPRLTVEMLTKRKEQCQKINYNTGGATLLGLSTG